MTYNIIVNDTELAALLDVLKSDFDLAFNNGEDSDVVAMEQDIMLLKSVSRAFKNDDAQLRLEVIISGYERDLRSVK